MYRKNNHHLAVVQTVSRPSASRPGPGKHFSAWSTNARYREHDMNYSARQGIIHMNGLDRMHLITLLPF